jgi:hypothetical protein
MGMTGAQEVIDTVKSVIVDAVKAAGPLGCPSGIIYAALMQYGCSLETYERFMALLVKERKLEKRGQCYHIKEAK